MGKILGKVVVAGLVFAMGIAVSTGMIVKYARLSLLGGIALVGAQLCAAIIGLLLGLRVSPRRLLRYLGLTSAVVFVLAVVAPVPEVGDRMIVGWSRLLWGVLVLPGVTVFGCWLGVVTAWLWLSRQVCEEEVQVVSGSGVTAGDAAEINRLPGQTE